MLKATLRLNECYHDAMDYDGNNCDISSMEKESQNLDHQSSSNSPSDSVEKAFDPKHMVDIMIEIIVQVYRPL